MRDNFAHLPIFAQTIFVFCLSVSLQTIFASHETMCHSTHHYNDL